MLSVHGRYLRQLVRDGRVSVETDGLPGEKEVAARRSAGGGLTTPELAVLLAQTKIGAGQEVLASDLPDDPYLRSALAGYFPVPLRERFAGQLGAHRLRREIITTEVINEMVDTGGSTFLFRLGEETGLPVPDITRAWLVAREVFGMPAFWRQVRGAGRDRGRGRADRGDPRGAQAGGTGDPLAAHEQAVVVRHRRDGELLRGRGRRGPFRDSQAAVGPGPCRVRGAAGLVRRARRARRARRRGRGHGAVVLRVRHRHRGRRDLARRSRRPRRCTSCSPTGCSSAGSAT